jgi:hypothetical protein
MGEERLQVGDVELRLPPGCTAKLLSRDENRTAVVDFILESPDHTVYHHESYFEYARRHDASQCDLVLFVEDGNPTFAMPVHFRPPNRVTTGYSGILLPIGGKEIALRRSIRSVGAFFDANPGLTFEVIQSVQAAAYDDPRRIVFMRRFLAELDLEARSLFARVVRFDEPTQVEEVAGGVAGSVKITPDSFENSLLASYDSGARSQIRQALRGGLSVSAFFGDRDAGTRSAYELIQPLHEATWARSGWSPHPLEYWLGLSAAINGPEEASDLVVTVSDAENTLVAAVVCHRYRERALYWSGCSKDDVGLKRANPLCLHAAISICRATGTELFEVGRFDAREPSSKERAVTRYKSQFRGELVEVVNFTQWTARARAVLLGNQIRDRTEAFLERLTK